MNEYILHRILSTKIPDKDYYDYRIEIFYISSIIGDPMFYLSINREFDFLSFCGRRITERPSSGEAR